MRSNSFIYTVFIFLFATSCVSKKKYLSLQKSLSAKDSALIAEQSKTRMLTDSLRAGAERMDSLTARLNEIQLKKEKSRSTGVVAKKSTMTREQECEKKSLFLYNFTKLVEWPIEYNGTEFIIGVAGDDMCLKQLQAFMAQKKVSGKRIIVEKYKKGARYNVVYVTSSESGSFSTVRNAVKKNKTLLVTDDALGGTHISFIVDQDKVRYLVDKNAIEKAGMKVGQELMRYAG